MSNTPNHVAIIMDGNRRWAKKRRLEALLGHDKGAETLEDITRSCADDAHINWLTVFAFSSENWARPEHEVAGLMRLIAKFSVALASQHLENSKHLMFSPGSAIWVQFRLMFMFSLFFRKVHIASEPGI